MAALLALLAAAALPAAHVAWGEFVPQPVQNELALDVAAIFENEESPCGEGQYETTDVFAKDRLRLSSEGFSYHPRFRQYRVKLAFALTQEEYSETGAEAVRYNDSGFDYDVRLHLLPEHPYSLRLFAVSVETLLPEYGFADVSTTYESLGAVFNYKDNPISSTCTTSGEPTSPSPTPPTPRTMAAAPPTATGRTPRTPTSPGRRTPPPARAASTASRGS